MTNPEKPLARRLTAIFRWLSRKLEVAYWLGASEARHGANETTNGMIPIQPNNY